MPSASVQEPSVGEGEEIALPDSLRSAFPQRRSRGFHSELRRCVAIFALSLLAILIDGYHPYSEDAGIYVASLKQLAYPGMFSASGTFLAPYARLSLFSHFGAWALRMLHLPLETVLFSLHVLTVWLLLYGGYGIARRCFRSEQARWGGVYLFALCLCVPVAGTSLSIADPYLTGRSFSTPFTLLAICAALDRNLWRTGCFLLLATLFHPLMGAYGVGLVLVLLAVQRRSRLAIGAVATASALAVAIVQLSHRSVPESAAYQAAVATRTYFFLSQWEPYEILGILAPLVLLALYVLWQQRDAKFERASVSVTLSLVVTGVLSISLSLGFCHAAARSHHVAALQPLRLFLFVYCGLFLFLGGLLGEFLLKQILWRWVAVALALGVGLGWIQHSVYPGSPQVELPGQVTQNPWHRAFDWVRSNTPGNAIVALDADYISSPNEDSLGFRAIAERDSLADRSKDGGASAVFPQLADRWLVEKNATTNLNGMDDAERLRRLAPFHVSWIVLDRASVTSLPCPFLNQAVKVCQLR